jgi:hypothetical protein
MICDECVERAQPYLDALDEHQKKVDKGSG